MTGLDANKHTLIEAAIIITDGNLKIIAESSNIVINQPDEVLENMEDWSKKHHALVIITILHFHIYSYNYLKYNFNTLYFKLYKVQLNSLYIKFIN